MDFKPIETQEALDAIISERLKRDREKQAEKFADYDDLKGKIAGYESQIGELNKQIEAFGEVTKENEALKAEKQKYETDSVKTRLTLEAGLPYGSTKYITGNTEEEIKASIADFQSFVKTSTIPAPLANPEPVMTKAGQELASNKALLAKLKGE